MRSPVRSILLPLGWLYGAGASLRNTAFDRGWLKSTGFDVPVVGVGNLSVGGSGKTPLVDYLVGLLAERKPAVLSRGYGRRTGGYRLAEAGASSDDFGDEPAMLKRRHPQLPVAVGERRVPALTRLLEDAPQTGVVVLDDAFQHRAIRPGLQVLVTPFHRPFCDDAPLPAGRLREWARGAERADVIVVTKTPEGAGERERSDLAARLRKRPDQPVLFAGLAYGALQRLDGSEAGPVGGSPYLVTGIADPQPLLVHTIRRWPGTGFQAFPDHHRFRRDEIERVAAGAAFGGADFLLTTEKDAMRWPTGADTSGLPVRVQPVGMAWHGEDGKAFDTRVLEYVVKAELSRPAGAQEAPIESP